VAIPLYVCEVKEATLFVTQLRLELIEKFHAFRGEPREKLLFDCHANI
jgi:hypothetical protein